MESRRYLSLRPGVKVPVYLKRHVGVFTRACITYINTYTNGPSPVPENRKCMKRARDKQASERG